MRLNNHPYAQCHIEPAGDAIVFVSYTTPVVVIDGDGYIAALPTYRCTPTTRKQVGWFLREYSQGVDYHMLRAATEGGHAIHAVNGDLRPL